MPFRIQTFLSVNMSLTQGNCILHLVKSWIYKTSAQTATKIINIFYFIIIKIELFAGKKKTAGAIKKILYILKRKN